MTLEALSIFTYGLLVFLGVLIQATYKGKTAGPAYGFSNNETPQPNKGPMGIRIDNMLANLKEGALMYLPFALLAVHFDISNVWTSYAALVTIISRIIYMPVYIIGIEKLRTLIWAPSFLAIPAMAYGIYLGIGG